MYFEVSKSKQKMVQVCNLKKGDVVIESDNGSCHCNKMFVKLRWEYIVLFATKAQLKMYDTQRTEYINSLLQNYCNDSCIYKIIGSQSPVSDIDIDIYSPNIQEVLNNILDFHNIHYNETLDTLFDVNIYASIFHYVTKSCMEKGTNCKYPKHNKDPKQLVWSFLRIVEYTESIPEIYESFSIFHRRLYLKALKLQTQLQAKYGSLDTLQKNQLYAKLAQRYINKLQNAKHNTNIAEEFSRLKYFELETYRSVGAVLHIVEKKESLPAHSLHESIYDNLGFIYENLLKEYPCNHGSLFNVKILKISKYLERICDAFLRLGKNTIVLQKLNKLSAKLNKYRKDMVPMKIVEPHINKLLHLLGYDSVSSLVSFSTDAVALLVCINKALGL